MYRNPRKLIERTVHTEAQLLRDGRIAVLFSSIAAILNTVSLRNVSLSISGVAIEFTDQFIIVGIFCGLAICFGFFVLSGIYEMFIFGYTDSSKHLFKNLICHIRNRHREFDYNPIIAKKVARKFLTLILAPLLTGYIILIIIYAIGVLLTADDFVRLLFFVVTKTLGIGSSA